jgi:HK97 family phage prohead protease
MENIEYRSRWSLDLKGRQGKLPIIVGYAAVFDSASDLMELADGRAFREIIRPGAFAASLRSREDVLARFEHSELLGRVANGTLRLFEDHRGLRYEIDPPETSVGRDLIALIRRHDVAASSFAFTVRPGGDAWRQDGQRLIRELRNVQLIDVAPVARPAYPATDVALRSLDSFLSDPAHRMRMRLELAERS